MIITQIRVMKIVLKLSVLAVFCLTVAAQANREEINLLRLNQKIEREIKGGEFSNYSLPLKKDEFVHVDVGQNGVDVTVRVFNPENQMVIERDAPNGAHGTEIVSFMAPASGVFRVEVKPNDEKAAAGKYSIELTAERAPTETDLRQVQTEQTFVDGIKMRDRKTPESAQAARLKFEEAIAGWQKLQNKYWESLTLEALAGLYYQTGEVEKALEPLNRSLVVALQDGEPDRIFSVLVSFGDVFNALKKTEKALDFYHQAADSARSSHNPENEIIAFQNLANVYSGDKQYAKTIEIYEKILTLYQAQKDQTGEAETLNIIGVQYSNAGDRKKSLEYYERAVNLAHDLKDAKIEAQALRNTGYDLSADGHYDQAIECYKRAFNLLKAANLDDPAIESLTEIAAIYKLQNKTAEFVKTNEQLLEFYRKAGNRKLEASVLNNIGLAFSRAGESSKAINYFEDSIKIFHEIGEKSDEATLNRNLALEYNTSGNSAKAIELFTQTIAMRRELKEFTKAAEGFRELSGIYQKAGDFTNQAAVLEDSLALYRQINDEPNIAQTLNFIGIAYSEHYKTEKTEANGKKAIASFEEGLTLARAKKNDYLETRILTNLGAYFVNSGQYTKSIDYFQTVLSYWQKQNSAADQALVWHGMGDALQGLNQDKKAVEAYLNALEFQKTLDQPGEKALLYNNLGVSYEALEIFPEAVKYYRLALQLQIDAKNKEGEMRADGNLSNVLYILGDKDNAATYAVKRWELAKELKNYEEQIDALAFMAEQARVLGEQEAAEKFFYKSYEIATEQKLKFKPKLGLTFGLLLLKPENTKKDKVLVEQFFNFAYEGARKEDDLTAEANALQALARMHFLYGDYQKSLEYLQKAFPLIERSGNLRFQAGMFGNFMALLKKQSKIQPAILYGKQAVNILQKIRYSIKDLDKDLQKSFLTNNENIYRSLADLLITEGRLPEAQSVLDLLKEEEFSEFVRRDGGESDTLAKNISLTETERKSLNEYTRLSDQLTSMGAHFQELTDKRTKAGGKLADAEETEYQTLKTQIETANEGLKKFLLSQIDEFSKKVEDSAVVTPQSIETLRADLRRAGSDVVLISTYLLPERYRAIVTTGRTMVDRKVEYKDLQLSADEINKKIAAFQQVLQNPKLDPRPLGKELYDIFVKPVEKDLAGAKAKTILWSLDGSLRYIPIAALSPDGKTYMAEKYQNVLVTLARQTHLFDKPSGDEWQVLGAGVSKKYENFSELPAVPLELSAIVRENSPDSKGVLNGKRLLNEEFNLDSFRIMLTTKTASGKPYNIIHLATHFKLGTTNQDSALLLGDGTRLSLYDAGKDEAIDFKDVELLTLSACETGVSIGNADGREVESMGMLAQQKGAKSVLATLWKVADESTQLFMVDFYRLHKENPTMSKAEAIRQAQIMMIEGNTQTTTEEGKKRAEIVGASNDKINAPPFAFDKNKPFAHPYYWSPFVLIGNWR